jgi:hypothetical protein
VPSLPDVVKTGTFVYGGSVTCDVRIVRLAIRPGSGDDEDAPEDRDDQPGPWFFVEYGSTTQRGHFSAGGGYHRTLADAEAEVHRQVRGVKWSA